MYGSDVCICIESTYRTIASVLRSAAELFVPKCRKGFFFAARRSYARAVLGVVILSVRLSVRLSVCLSHACFVTNPENLPAIFYTT